MLPGRKTAIYVAVAAFSQRFRCAAGLHCAADRHETRYSPLPGLVVWPKFATDAEQLSAMVCVEPALRRLRRQEGHFDGVISSYRELDRPLADFASGADMNALAGRETFAMLQRARQWVDSEKALVGDEKTMNGFVWSDSLHVVDLSSKGEIRPHVDSVKFAGDVVSGVSLISARVMRFCRTSPDNSSDLMTPPGAALYCSNNIEQYDTHLPGECVDILLEPGSLYAMSGFARYAYTHAVLSGEIRSSLAQVVARRRVSLIQRSNSIS